MIEFPAVPPGDPLRLSASTYVAFLDCPDAARARLEGFWGPESRPAFKGGLAHRVFARHLTSGPIPAAEFGQVCRQEIGGSTLNYKVAALGLKPSGVRNVIEEVGALYRRFRRFPSEGFEGAEMNLSVEPAEGVTLVGSIDAVFRDDKGPKLVDWKTGGLGSVQEQLRFYVLLWVLRYGELPAAVEAVSVQTGERFGEEPTETMVEETAALVADAITRIRRGWEEGRALERRGGPWCRFCGLLGECEEGSAAAALY